MSSKTTKNVEATHGLLFLVDPSFDDFELPELDLPNPVSGNSHCISIAVEHYQFGTVEIGFSDAEDELSGTQEYYSGKLVTKSKEIAFISPELMVLLSHEVASEQTRLSVRLDGPLQATIAVVVIE